MKGNRKAIVLWPQPHPPCWGAVGPELLSAKTNPKRKRLSTRHVFTQYTTEVIHQHERHRLWILECPLSRFSRAWVEIPSSLSCPRQWRQWHCQRETSKNILETSKVTKSRPGVKGDVISCQTPSRPLPKQALDAFTFSTSIVKLSTFSSCVRGVKDVLHENWNCLLCFGVILILECLFNFIYVWQQSRSTPCPTGSPCHVTWAH